MLDMKRSGIARLRDKAEQEEVPFLVNREISLFYLINSSYISTFTYL